MNNRGLLPALAFIFCACLVAAAGSPGITPAVSFSPPEWKFGMILQGATIQAAVTATNHESRTLSLTFVPTCTCLTVTPAVQRIPPGGEAIFVMRYDSSDDVGITTRGYIVHSDLRDSQPLYYLVRGTVRAERGTTGSTGAWSRQDAAPGGGSQTGVVLSYYYTPGCRSCEEFLSVEIPRLEKKLGMKISLTRKDVLDSALFEELSAFAAAQGQSIRAIPALRAGDVLLQGDQEIRAKLEGVLVSAADRAAADRAAAQPKSATPAAGGGVSTISDRLAILPVIIAGLVDGINPCAFTTLIFLLASLALGGRGRREVLLIGALFSLPCFSPISPSAWASSQPCGPRASCPSCRSSCDGCSWQRW